MYKVQGDYVVHVVAHVGLKDEIDRFLWRPGACKGCNNQQDGKVGEWPFHKNKY